MKNRFMALCVLAALVATSCGSRLDEQELAAGGGSGSPAVQQPTTPGGTPTGPEGPAFGTLAAPCRPAEGDAPAPTKGEVPGVSADTITIGVISDKAGVVKVPTVSVEESVKAFVDWCNDLGGINGRTLSLKTYDAKLTAGDEAAKQACSDDLFALVGTGVVMDDKVAEVVVGCGLPNVAAYTATAKMALADLMVTPLPNPTNTFNTAPGRWIAEQHPDAIEKAAILASNLPTATVQADRIQAAYEQAGFEFVYRKNTEIIQTSYAAEVSEMKAKGVEYVTMVSATSETTKLLKDMEMADFAPEVVDLGQQYYDPELLAEPGAEGALVQSNTVPFEDADAVPALQQFLDAYDAVGTKVQAASLGVQAFSAGLLFAVAADAAGDDLSRDTLMAELKGIHEWDGGGLHYTADPGANRSSTCFVYLRVEGGEFVRSFPEEAGAFECGEPSVVVDLGSDYGGGAKAGS